MNVLLWVLQVLLALHTLIGAVWKFSNSEQAVPSLNALPHGFWLGLGVFELFVGAALVLPALAGSPAVLAPVAAACVAAEMLLFTGVHLGTGHANDVGPMAYWLVVAAVSAFIVWGRLVAQPL